MLSFVPLKYTLKKKVQKLSLDFYLIGTLDT